MKRISCRSLPLRPAFSIVLLTLLSNSNLTGQFIPSPTSQERPAEETDIYLVTFQTGTPASERSGVVQASGALLRRTFTSANAVSVQVPNTAALSRLRNHPRVISVFANRPITLAAPGGTAQGKGKGGGGNGGGSGGNGAGGNGGNKQRLPATWQRPQFLRVTFPLPGPTSPTMNLDSRSSAAPVQVVAISPRLSRSAPIPAAMSIRGSRRSPSTDIV